jgi:hypothetical protein
VVRDEIKKNYKMYPKKKKAIKKIKNTIEIKAYGRTIFLFC